MEIENLMHCTYCLSYIEPSKYFKLRGKVMKKRGYHHMEKSFYFTLLLLLLYISWAQQTLFKEIRSSKKLLTVTLLQQQLKVILVLIPMFFQAKHFLLLGENFNSSDRVWWLRPSPSQLGLSATSTDSYEILPKKHNRQ